MGVVLLKQKRVISKRMNGISAIFYPILYEWGRKEEDGEREDIGAQIISKDLTVIRVESRQGCTTSKWQYSASIDRKDAT